MSQPLVTAVQVALVELLISWNVKATASVGHSSGKPYSSSDSTGSWVLGEIAATYASGQITAAEAIIVAYARGRAISRNHQSGAMLAVGMNDKSLAPFLSKYPSIVVACHNSPDSKTLSGDLESILALKEALSAQNIFARVLKTDGNAYNSQHMLSLGAGYETELVSMLQSLHSTSHRSVLPRSEYFSSVTGGLFWKEHADASYWRKNLESPVLFSQALATMIESTGIDIILEVGPHSALQDPIRQIAKSMPDTKFPKYISTLLRNEDGALSLLNSMGLLFSNGYDIDHQQVNSLSVLSDDLEIHSSTRAGRVIPNLPKYQWQYSDTLYFENRWAREWRFRSHAHHDILGSRLPGGNANEPIWRNVLRKSDIPWLQDHKVSFKLSFYGKDPSY
jgi:acyl transferase domain-containing protein